MPIGLYNENRDSDFLLPMIFLPQSIYDETKRDINVAYVGGGVYGNVNAGSLGDCDYHLFLGKIDFPSDSVLHESQGKTIETQIRRNKAISDPAMRNPDIPSAFYSSELESDHVYGGAFVYNSEWIDELRLGFSFLHTKYETYVNGSAKPAGDTVVHGRFVISAEYSWRDFVFISEYNETDRTYTFFDKVTADGPSQAYYVMVNYTPFERWTFSAMYDEFYPFKHDKDGSSMLQLNSSAAWRKDISVGARWAISDFCVAKAEYHWIDGTSLQTGLFNADGAGRYWSYGAARISFFF